MYIWATANNQLTINPKDGEMPSLSSWPLSIIAFGDLRFPSANTGKRISPGMQWWTRVRIPKKALFQLHGWLLAWLLSLARSHNLCVFYPRPVGNLTLFEAAPFHLYIHIALLLASSTQLWGRRAKNWTEFPHLSNLDSSVINKSDIFAL